MLDDTEGDNVDYEPMLDGAQAAAQRAVGERMREGIMLHARREKCPT